MSVAQTRFWRFDCGHIGGEVKMLRMGAGRVRILLLYEQSMVTEPSRRPALRGRIEGSMFEIRCTICGRTRDWVIGEEAMQELLRRRYNRLQMDLMPKYPLYHIGMDGCGGIAFYTLHRLVEDMDDLIAAEVILLNGKHPVNCVNPIVCGTCGNPILETTSNCLSYIKPDDAKLGQPG